MSEYVLSCCSTADIDTEYLEKIDVKWIPFHFFVDDVEYSDDMGKSLSYSELYRRMEGGAEVRTSQVSIGEYIDFFKQFLDEGKDVIHFALSTGISGTYNSAKAAGDMVSAEYPDRKVYVVDSLAASSGIGLLLDKLSELRAQGMGIDELRETAEALKHKVNHLFYTTDLTYFVKGGRVSKAEGVLGGLLSICPLLCVSPTGTLEPMAKVKGKKKVIARTVNEMEGRAKDGAAYSGKCFISNSECAEDAEKTAELIRERFPNIKEISIFPIGTTIGCHTGPGTVAVFFFGEEDRVI